MRGAVTEEDLNRGRSSNGNAGKDVEETGTQSGEGNEMDTEEDELDDEDPDDYIESTQLNRRGVSGRWQRNEVGEDILNAHCLCTDGGRNGCH